MNFRNILLAILFIFLSNCTAGNYSVNTQKDIFKKGFSNKGFALIYDQKLYKDGLISKKIDERSLVIFQKNLKINTQVKITNILNNKSIIGTVGKNSHYPYISYVTLLHSVLRHVRCPDGKCAAQTSGADAWHISARLTWLTNCWILSSSSCYIVTRLRLYDIMMFTFTIL